MSGATVNINIGVVGHVDSGKTSLVRALSTHISTAALDKNPQSQARGITLDLGFSSFTLDAPERLASSGVSRLQFTLVDCPGHASLIRTIIGGAHIIDMMLLVVDALKGVQTQTAECLVVGEITTDRLVVVLNKTDLLPEATREAAIEKAAARIRKVLATTKFADAPIIPVAAAPGGKPGEAPTHPATASVAAAAAQGEGSGGVGSLSPSPPSSVAPLVSHLLNTVTLPVRDDKGPFLFAVDHCFQIKGQGTVLTGTVLSGRISVNDTLELPSLRVEKKVKSMQMFKRPVASIGKGDRAGICVTGLDPTAVERGLACTPGSIPTLSTAVALVKRVKYFKEPLTSGCRLHVSVGHTTVMAEAHFFGAKELLVREGTGAGGDQQQQQQLQQHSGSDIPPPLCCVNTGAANAGAGGGGGGGRTTAVPALPSTTPAQSWEFQEALLYGAVGGGGGGEAASASAPAPSSLAPSPQGGPPPPSPLRYEWQFVALLFDTPILAPLGAMVIGSRLDGDVNGTTCRLALHGRVVGELPKPGPPEEHPLACLRFYKHKMKQGVVDRVEESSGGGGGGVTLVGRGLFKKEVDMNQFSGLVIETPGGAKGRIEGAFGKTGKFKAYFREGGVGLRPGEPLILKYRKYMYGAGGPGGRFVQV